MLAGANRLDTNASLPPVPSLRIVANLCMLVFNSSELSRTNSYGVASPKANPLWDRTVLLLSLCKLLLGAE